MSQGGYLDKDEDKMDKVKVVEEKKRIRWIRIRIKLARPTIPRAD